MKKIWLFILVIISFISPVFAQYGITLEQFLYWYLSTVTKDISLPSSYHDIRLKYTNIAPKNPLYDLLQKGVYLNVFPNARVELPLDKQVTQDQIISVVSQYFDVSLWYEKKAPVTVDWFQKLLNEISLVDFAQSSLLDQDVSMFSRPLFIEVYQRLHDTYLWSESWFDEKKLMYGAIKWLVESLEDPYTAFFPPTETSTVVDELEWEYYGIGTHVEMVVPWELVIVSPMKNSPAEKVWLLWGDRIVQINDTVVDKNMSLMKATSLIKGPAWTVVLLKIFRNGKLIDFSLTREKIVLKNLEYSVVSQDSSITCLVSISLFDFWISDDFEKAMMELSSKKCNKYVFDIRNNPWWSLQEVVRMLNYFVPAWKTSVTIKTKTLEQNIVAWDAPSSKVKEVPIRILINQWSASASEIFAAVVKEYLPSTLLIGQKTFGKWSVQEMLYYEDGSMLKYTVAKRYTGKMQKNIDKVGVSPDKLMNNKKETLEDEVLDRAIAN